jgi:hypothetical protein
VITGIPMYLSTYALSTKNHDQDNWRPSPDSTEETPNTSEKHCILSQLFRHFVTNTTTRNLHAEFRPVLNTKIHRYEIPFSLIYLTCNNSIRPELGNIWSTRSVITALSALLTVLASTDHNITYCRIPEWEVMQLTSRHKQ